MNIIVYWTCDSTGGRSSRLSEKLMKGGSKFQVMYFEVGQWDGLHEVKAECNSKKVLQDPDPPGRGGRWGGEGMCTLGHVIWNNIFSCRTQTGDVQVFNLIHCVWVMRVCLCVIQRNWQSSLVVSRSNLRANNSREFPFSPSLLYFTGLCRSNKHGSTFGTFAPITYQHRRDSVWKWNVQSKHAKIDSDGICYPRSPLWLKVEILCH